MRDAGACDETFASYGISGLTKMARMPQKRRARKPSARGRVAASVVPGVALDPLSREPLQRQLYAALRDAIRALTIPAGTRLPSTRFLAESLALSRTTVSLAYEQLRAEGYLRGRERSGSFVNALLPDDALLATRPGGMPNEGATRQATKARRAQPSSKRDLSPSERGRVLSTLVVSSTPTPGGSPPICFRMGTPALDRFPLSLWGTLLARRWRALTAAQLAYGDPAGLPTVREAIASYARQARAVRCDASQVIVVSGAQQGFDLVARVLLDVGDTAVVEDPGYRGIRAALIAAGAKVAPVPIDAQGLDVTAMRSLVPHARMACVTPSHQFPLGVTMSAPRRHAMLEWARATDGWILEDDFDSEYRFRARPLPSLQGMDDSSRVLYIGTFSKTLFPALRLGYLIVPPALVATFTSARAAVDRHPPTLEQSVLADFIGEGHFARHVRRMRALYAERQETLLSLLERDLGEFVDGERMEAGMHLVAWLREPLTRHANVIDRRVAAAALERGVAAVALSALTTHSPPRPALLLGFSAHDEASMRRGVATLRDAVLDVVREGPRSSLRGGGTMRKANR
jgi:GntR family transcriptional regulator/MocR family aminotransferase